MKLNAAPFIVLMLLQIPSFLQSGLTEEQSLSSDNSPSWEYSHIYCCAYEGCSCPLISLEDFPSPEMIAAHLFCEHNISSFDIDQNRYFDDGSAFSLNDSLQIFTSIKPFYSSCGAISKKENNAIDISRGKYRLLIHCMHCSKKRRTLSGLKKHYKREHPSITTPDLPSLTYICKPHQKIYTKRASALSHILQVHQGKLLSRQDTQFFTIKNELYL